MKTWGTLCLLAIVALSGCFGDAETVDPDAADGGVDDGTDDGMDDGTADDNGTADGTNTAPAADFEANQTEGEVPFDVTFAWNASDADGDDLTWTLDVDGDGEADSEGALLPFNFTYTYDTAGTYNATLNVTDGTNATVGVVTITAATPEDGSGGDEGNETQEAAFTPIHVQLEIIEGCELCIDSAIVTGEQMGAAGCVGWNAGINEIDCSWLTLPPEAAGHTYTVDGERTNIPDNPATGPADDMDPDVEFFDTCSADGTSMGIIRNSGPERGTVPEGAGCMVIMEFFWPNAGALHTIDIV